MVLPKHFAQPRKKIAHTLRTSIRLLGETFGEDQKGAGKIQGFWDRRQNV
jgi:hypothetical protein